jgi:hypothetical protein
MESKTATIFVRVFAVFAWISALFSLLAALAFMVGGPLLDAMFLDEGLSGATVAVSTVLGAVALCFGVLYFFLGLGLWRHQNWARIAALVFAWIGIIMIVLSIPSLFQPPYPVAGWLFGAAILAVQLYIFQFEPSVKALFTRRNS